MQWNALESIDTDHSEWRGERGCRCDPHFAHQNAGHSMIKLLPLGELFPAGLNLFFVF